MDNNTKKDIVQQEKHSARFRLGFILYIITLLIYPYIFIFHHFFPHTYSFGADKSIAVAVITLILVFSFLLQGKNIIAKLGKKNLYFYIFVFIFLLTARYLIYEEKIVAKVMAYRIFILPIIYAGLACYYLSDQKKRQLVLKIVFCQALIQAVIGIFVWKFVYTGIISHEILRPWQGGGRISGTLVSANLFPDFILLGAFILISSHVKWRLPHFVKIVLLLIFTLVITYSNSRLPFCVVIIVLLIAFKNAFLAKKNYFAKTLIIAIIVITIFFGSLWLPNAAQNTISRTLNPGPDLRLIKYKLGLSNVLESVFRGVLIGPSIEERSNRIMIIRDEGIAFSDNSFITLMRLSGVLFTLLYLLFFVSIIKKNYYIKGNYFLLFFIVSVLFFTNSILWDFWIFFVFATLYSLQPQQKIKIIEPKKMLITKSM